MAIVSVTEVQTALQTTLSGTQLALLNFIHPLVEGMVKSWLGTHMEFAQTTEILPIGRSRTREPLLEDARREGPVVRLQSNVGGLKTLQLRNVPVWESGIEVREDLDAKGGAATDAFPAGSILEYGNICWLDIDEHIDDDNRLSHSGILYRSGYWPQEPRTVKVTYFGGETAARLADSNHASHIKMGALICHLHAYKAIAQLKGQGGVVKAVTGERIGKYSYQTPEAVTLATSILNLGVPLAAQEAMMKAKNMAVFG